MGCCFSGTANNKETEEGKEYKVLLLGAGESGKSTILKQMKLLFNDSQFSTERDQYVGVIRQNIMQSLTALINASARLKIPIKDEKTKLIAQKNYNNRL